MSRFFIRLSFNGSRYAGWQKQNNALAVQQILEDSLARLAGTPIVTTGCGRTDTGVHASRFYAHADLPDDVFVPEEWTYRLNAVLPDDIAVQELIPVAPEAHARFDATLRTYRYFMSEVRNPFLQEFTYVRKPLPDPERMNAAAAGLIGTHDFTAFSKTGVPLKSPACTIHSARWTHEAPELVFEISADRFLRGMVRLLVGSMLDIGYSRKEPGVLIRILNSGDRAAAGAAVPARGLFLCQVRYPYLAVPETNMHPFRV